MRKIKFAVWLLAVFLALSTLLSAASTDTAREQAPQKATPVAGKSQTAPAVKAAPEKEEDIYKQLELFSDTLSIVRSEYVDDVKTKTLIYGALKGMVQSLDKFSEFMDPESYAEMKVETEGEFGGIGIEIAIKDDLLTVIAPIDDTPAFKAGVKAGDRIVKIDKDITRGITLVEAVKKLRGKPGTPVTITVLRESESKVLDFSITRDTIKVKSIKNPRILEDKIGYIKLSIFQERSARDLEDALVELEKQGMDSLILDLRNDPGGLLNVAAEVSGKFLPAGEMIVYTKGRNDKQEMEFRAKNKKPRTDYPMVVLVDQGSASGSEIVAGALQDHRRAVLVGMKTFGKGSVQTVIPLSDGSAIRLTTSKYYTPNGRSIHGQGIIPDIVVEFKPVKKEAAPKEDPAEVFEKLEEKPGKPSEKKEVYDNQLQTAVDAIKTMRIYKSSVVKK
ncbi:MAG: S41 family peptidase [Candidatus Omnitrophica bacterium]|nr:S41 family peptidase [Candidatus Omnitrophota bacterium]